MHTKARTKADIRNASIEHAVRHYNAFISPYSYGSCLPAYPNHNVHRYLTIMPSIGSPFIDPYSQSGMGGMGMMNPMMMGMMNPMMMGMMNPMMMGGYGMMGGGLGSGAYGQIALVFLIKHRYPSNSVQCKSCHSFSTHHAVPVPTSWSSTDAKVSTGRAGRQSDACPTAKILSAVRTPSRVSSMRARPVAPFLAFPSLSCLLVSLHCQTGLSAPDIHPVTSYTV
ncbi:hypothetical protein BD324DRAFT_609885 [Kockovaella imperatae]|uniref:Uncharacterized protein n=1 Tax=Kockovaella imperatae TaxID=4999 RepID=A0A1Y1UAY1_9TREE|nr:hypothetical protein BD324DRAFT_609885 [Kockovaella imperatae]ORX34704.1 hypothetical protein BD324DRAFT_609885 [Kockovaella imperatae]